MEGSGEGTFDGFWGTCTDHIPAYPLTCRGPVSGTQNIDTVVFLFPRGELKEDICTLAQ